MHNSTRTPWQLIHFQARRDLGHTDSDAKLFSMLANISSTKGYLGKKEALFWAEKQKLPKRVWVKAALIGLSQAETRSIAGLAGDEGCLVELGKAVDTGFQRGAG